MNEPERFQWRLQSVLLFVTLLSLYLGLWRDTRTIYEQRFDAGVLPSNDQALWTGSKTNLPSRKSVFRVKELG